MFSNFEDSFVKKPYFSEKIPDAILETLNLNLPNGLKYSSYDNTGICILDSEDMLNISSGTVTLPKIIAENLPEKFSMEDLMEYSYNSQTPIEISPNQDGSFTVNENKILATDFIKKPLEGIEVKKMSFLIIPNDFPAPVKIQLGVEDLKIEISTQRKPVESLYKKEYSSIDEGPLKVIYLINNDKIDFNLSVLPNNAKNVEELINAYKIFNGFLDGCGKFNGIIMSSTPKSISEHIPEEIILFWEKCKSIESASGKLMDVNDSISNNVVHIVESLYVTLVLKKPFKGFIQNNEFELLAFDAAHGESLDDLVDNEFIIEFEQTELVEFLGVTLNLFCYNIIFNSKISKVVSIEKDSKNYDITLTSINEKKMYTSKIYFLDKNEMKQFKNDKNRFDIMRDAQEIEFCIKYAPYNF